MLGREPGVIDAVDHGEVGVRPRRGDQHCPRTRFQMRRSLLARGEDACAFERHVDPEIGPGQPCRIALAQHPYRPGADVDAPVTHLDRAGEAPVHRVVAQQVGVGFHVAEIVEGDDGEIGAAGLVNRAQDVAADAPEPVDGDANRHASSAGSDAAPCYRTDLWRSTAGPAGADRGGPERPRAAPWRRRPRRRP